MSCLGGRLCSNKCHSNSLCFRRMKLIIRMTATREETTLLMWQSNSSLNVLKRKRGGERQIIPENATSSVMRRRNATREKYVLLIIISVFYICTILYNFSAAEMAQLQYFSFFCAGVAKSTSKSTFIRH